MVAVPSAESVADTLPMNSILFIVPLQLNPIVGYNACRGSGYSVKSGSWEGDVFNLLARM